jgi:hypothetical protein
VVDVGETKCCLFCLATLRFTNKSHRIRSSRSSYFDPREYFHDIIDLQTESTVSVYKRKKGRVQPAVC